MVRDDIDESIRIVTQPQKKTPKSRDTKKAISAYNQRSQARIELSKQITRHWIHLTLGSTIGVFILAILTGFQLYGFYLDHLHMAALVGLAGFNSVLPYVVQLLKK